MRQNSYKEQIELLLAVAEGFATGSNFVLKGGNAINLFVENMPRVSFDLDYVFCDSSLARAEALARIDNDLKSVCRTLTEEGFRCFMNNAPTEAKCVISRGKASVKVEVNTVFRGTLKPVCLRSICPRAEDIFRRPLQVSVLDTDELYAGKFVAALDRQHPRDFYDVRRFWQRGEAVTESLLDCFVVYLAASNRPAHEVLFGPDRLDEGLFHRVTEPTLFEPSKWDDLKEVRCKLKKEIISKMTPQHRRFLVSVTRAQPQWELLPFAGLSSLPAIQWKLRNLKKLAETNSAKFEAQGSALEDGFATFTP
ncbi:MAG: nucleotidyl transferase AbiEii/AbiGii toxin family protein [Sutterellaceae bacterium]|nr:nucleotidyl transferase AbiEii/AbiGii toxin family protein [Sutterellaceae bacterium]